MAILIGYPNKSGTGGSFSGSGSIITTQPEVSITGERVLRGADGIIIIDNGPEDYVDIGVDGTVVRTTLNQTVTNKTLILPIITYGWLMVTSNYTVTPADSFILVNASLGPVTVTLPSASTLSGRRITVKKTDSSSNIVTVSVVDLIDGAGQFKLNLQGESIDAFCNGSSYFII